MLLWLRRFSIRSRLSVLIAGAVGITLALASLASYVVADHQLFRQVDSSLRTTADSVFQLRGIPCSSSTGVTERCLDPQQAESYLQHDGQGDVLAVIQAVGPALYKGPVALPESASDRVVAANQSASRIRTQTIAGVRYRIITTGTSSDGQVLKAADGVTPLALEIGHPLTDTDRTLADLRLILFFVSLAGVALAVGLGYLVARATIRPVQRLTSAAEHVAQTQDLAATIDEQGDDELTRLAKAFNAMLGALDASRHQQAQLVSDAGHELRTPLTSLRTNVEVLMRMHDLPPADREELLADVQGQLEELTTLIGDIVELGRQDEQQPEPTEIRLDQLVERAVERARRRAPSLTFRVQLDRGSVRAQPALLERAVLNVLDNATKWSPSGGSVDVWLQHQDRWLLDVRDEGPGISPEDIPHVFDRFYRAQTARALPGSGLGLAIVRQVVAAHGGTVQLWCPPAGGTVVHIELPTVTEQEPDAPWWDGSAGEPGPPVAAGDGATPDRSGVTEGPIRDAPRVSVGSQDSLSGRSSGDDLLDP